MQGLGNERKMEMRSLGVQITQGSCTFKIFKEKGNSKSEKKKIEIGKKERNRTCFRRKTRLLHVHGKEEQGGSRNDDRGRKWIW